MDGFGMTRFSRLIACSLALLAVPVAALCYDADGARIAVPSNGAAAPGLANATILIVRHAEKPSDGSGLDAEGVARSKAYVGYFQNFRFDGAPLHIDALVATADSPASERPRLTLAPLSEATHIPIQQPFGNAAIGGLVDWLKAAPRGHTILVAWHHGKIPELVAGLGADPADLFTFRHWSPSVFGDVVVLRFDGNGRLLPDGARIVHENLTV